MEKLKYSGFLFFLLGSLARITYFSPDYWPGVGNSLLTISVILLSIYCIRKITNK